MSEAPEVLDTLSTLAKRLNKVRAAKQGITLVPTMGNLHEGHLALVREAGKSGDFVIVSIFVNPLQFGPTEDLDRYPRTFQADLELLQSVNCNAVFAPDAQDIYPDGIKAHTVISVPGLSTLHCGQSRPGHFDGVCTVVYKLFTSIRPDRAVFGLKDYQQFLIIKHMTRDLQLPVDLIGIPTVRESSGLAMSSRNSYLTDEEKFRAEAIHAILTSSAEAINNGAHDFGQVESSALNSLTEAGLRPDYFHICNRNTLQQASKDDQELVILVAAYAGKTRLIDNMII